MKRLIAAVLASAALVMGTPGAAVAAVPVYVDVNVLGSQPAWAQKALAWIDQYTATEVHFGECVEGRRCIRLNPGRIYDCERPSRNNGCAETGFSITDPETRICTITMDTRPVESPRGESYWRRLYKHEAGHCYGLGHSTGNNLMRPSLYINGVLVSESFAPSQISAIAPY